MSFAREDVEPYIAALLQAEHVNLLVGAGLTIGLSRYVEHAPPDMDATLQLEDQPLADSLEEAAGRSAKRLRRHQDESSLDIFWLRDESLEDTDNLPPPGVIAAEIVEDLEAALAEFSEIAASLSGEEPE